MCVDLARVNFAVDIEFLILQIVCLAGTNVNCLK